MTDSSLYLQAQVGNILNETTEIINGFQVRSLLLGHTAYPSTGWLLKPYPHNLNLTEEEKPFNESHSSLQVTVERTFGLFSVVYLSLVLNSPVKIYSLIYSNKESYYRNIAKYTTEATKLELNIFTTYFIHKFYKTNKFFT